MKFTDEQRAELIDTLNKKGTAFVVAEPCQKCGCDVRYQKGCVLCARATKQKAVEWNGQVDANGVKLSDGKRRCTKCQSAVKIAENAYGAKAGKCWQCAIENAGLEANTKEILTVGRKVREQLFAHAAHCVKSAKTIKVIPDNTADWYAVQDLFMRCRMMNELDSDDGIEWEICHRYPASGTGSVIDKKGRMSTGNLFIGLKQDNRKAGDTLPEVWQEDWVITITDKDWLTKFEKLSEQIRERVGLPKPDIAKAKARTAALTKRMVEEHKTALSQFAGELTIDALHRFVSKEWQCVQHKLKRRQEFCASAVKVHDKQLFDVEVLSGRSVKLLIVKMTFEQIRDACPVIPFEIERALLLWATETLSKNTMTVVGFSHQLIADTLVWGTKLDETGKAWLSAWKHNSAAEAQIAAELEELNNRCVYDPELFNRIRMLEKQLEREKRTADKSGFSDWDLMYTTLEMKAQIEKEEAERAEREKRAAEKRKIEEDFIQRKRDGVQKFIDGLPLMREKAIEVMRDIMNGHKQQQENETWQEWSESLAVELVDELDADLRTAEMKLREIKAGSNALEMDMVQSQVRQRYETSKVIQRTMRKTNELPF